MQIIKKFTAIRVYETRDTDKDVSYPTFTYGSITGPYYSLTYPETEFDTEEEAIKYAYESGKYTTWMIVPIIRFSDN